VVADAATATQEKVAAAASFAREVHGAVTKLQSIQPPPVIRGVHAEFVASMEQMADAIDKYVAALGTGKLAQIEAVMPTLAAAQARMQAAANVLLPKVGVQVPATP
jgi:hypothetical protein